MFYKAQKPTLTKIAKKYFVTNKVAHSYLFVTSRLTCGSRRSPRMTM